MHLDTLQGVRSEMARLYRSAINQKIKTSEAARLVFILKEVRACIEAIPPDPVVEQPTTISIISVPYNHFVRSEDGLATSIGPLTLEHRPMVEEAEMVVETAESSLDSESNIIDRARDIPALRETIVEETEQAPIEPTELERARLMGYVPLPRRAPRSGW